MSACSFILGAEALRSWGLPQAAPQAGAHLRNSQQSTCPASAMHLPRSTVRASCRCVPPLEGSHFHAVPHTALFASPRTIPGGRGSPGQSWRPGGLYLVQGARPHVAPGQRLVVGEDHRVVLGVGLVAAFAHPAAVVRERVMETPSVEGPGSRLGRPTRKGPPPPALAHAWHTWVSPAAAGGHPSPQRSQGSWVGSAGLGPSRH